jgi:hypothetical protein
MTFDHVRTGEWYQMGFRHATQAEVSTLFRNAGTPDDNFDTSVTYPEATKSLILKLGSTIGDHSTYGFTGTDFFGNNVTDLSHPVGTPFTALLGKLDYLDLTAYGMGELGEAHFSGDHPMSNEASQNYGSFLVRSYQDVTPVPIPGAVWLLGSGLVGLIGARRRFTI